MNEILLINDQAAAMDEFASFVLNLAQRLDKNIIVANFIYQPEPLLFAHAGQEEPTDGNNDLLAYLNKWHLYSQGHKPTLEFLDATDFTQRDLANFINQRQISMVVQSGTESTSSINIQSLLNQILCPLLVVPDNCGVKSIKRIMYLTDLRYCQVPVVHYLNRLNQKITASILIAHICASGLPDLDKGYANDLFSNGISMRVKMRSLFFNHIKEKDMTTTVDTMIHGMHADLLVCQNRGFHLDQLLGNQQLPGLPEYLTVPLLVFPS